MTESLSIGKVADLTGLSPRQLRYLEGKGLVKPSRSPGGQRIFDPETIPVLERIRYLRQKGLSLEEICEHFSPQAQVPCDANIWFGGDDDNS